MNIILSLLKQAEEIHGGELSIELYAGGNGYILNEYGGVVTEFSNIQDLEHELRLLVLVVT